MKKLIRNLLVFLLLIGAGAAALPFVLNDDEDYEARLVGAILFVEETLEEGASGSHHRLYEPKLKSLSGENSWELEAKIRSTDEFNQENFGNLTAALTSLCKPYSLAACWRLDNLMIDGALAELERVGSGQSTQAPSGGDDAAEGNDGPGDLSAGNAGEVPDALDELEAGSEEAAESSSETESAETPEPTETAEAPAPESLEEDGSAEAVSPTTETATVETSESIAAEQPAPEDDKDLVALVQRQLDRLGYVPGPPDGVFGPRTERAIKAYQEDHQMAASGQITNDLLRALQIPQTANSN